MWVLTILIACFGGILRVLIDLAIVFCVGRVLRRHFNSQILVTLDRIGAPLVEEITTLVKRHLERLCKRRMTDGSALAATLLSLIVVRTLAIALARGLASL